METTSTSEAIPNRGKSREPGGRGRSRGGRGGRGGARGGAAGSNSTGSSSEETGRGMEASITQRASSSSPTPSSGSSASSRRGGRGGGGGSRRGGGGSRGRSGARGGRNSASSSAGAGLRVNAAPFVPSEEVAAAAAAAAAADATSESTTTTTTTMTTTTTTTTTTKKERKQHPKKSSSSSSSAVHHHHHQQQQPQPQPNFSSTEPTGSLSRADELIRLLHSNELECMVCCSIVSRKDHVLSCQECFAIFHKHCLHKWIRSSAPGGAQTGWRCPACQTTSTVYPSQYRCFCGKVVSPRDDPSTTPHSCGALCGKKRSCKTHKCAQLCHPGPCPPCAGMVTRRCWCSKISTTVRCKGNLERVSCGGLCNRQLECGRHRCRAICHEGPCESCPVTYQDRCFCGKHKRTMSCVERVREPGQEGTYSCAEPCDAPLRCGNCKCKLLCHAGSCGSCRTDTQSVSTCPCGRRELTHEKRRARLSCRAPVPLCDSTLPCGRQLPCGHGCPRTCHEGDCGPCTVELELACVCGAESMHVVCAEHEPGFEFRCRSLCNEIKSCGRHRCSTRCCAAKGPDEHFCMLTCGRRLQCGVHACEAPCHRGRCPPCLMAEYNEVACHCGLTVLFPPVKCGTPPPQCKQRCAREHRCDHAVMHTCHNLPQCPPCAVLVQRPCKGAHESRTVTCSSTAFSCGRKCGRPFPCGHRCIQPCHEGSCAPNDCVQPCTAKRDSCGHPCNVPCHPDLSECPDAPCETPVDIQCPCGRRKGRSLCGQTTTRNADSASTATASTTTTSTTTATSSATCPLSSVITSALDASTPYQMAALSHALRGNVLDCDTDCAIEERNRRLADALSVDRAARQAERESLVPDYPESLLDAVRINRPLVRQLESHFHELVVSLAGTTMSATHLPVMKASVRHLVHEMAPFYNVTALSVDAEPKRSVILTRNVHSRLPTVLLSETVTASHDNTNGKRPQQHTQSGRDTAAPPVSSFGGPSVDQLFNARAIIATLRDDTPLQATIKAATSDKEEDIPDSWEVVEEEEEEEEEEKEEEKEKEKEEEKEENEGVEKTASDTQTQTE